MVRNFASQNIDPLEAARTLAEELKSVSGKLASWQPGNLGEEFILGRSDWGCFELKERDLFGYAVTVFVSLEYCHCHLKQLKRGLANWRRADIGDVFSNLCKVITNTYPFCILFECIGHPPMATAELKRIREVRAEKAEYFAIYR